MNCAQNMLVRETVIYETKNISIDRWSNHNPKAKSILWNQKILTEKHATKNIKQKTLIKENVQTCLQILVCSYKGATDYKTERGSALDLLTN